MPGYPITAHALCNATGMTTRDVLAALREGRSGLAPCPAVYGIEAIAGALPAEPERLPASLADRDTRIARILAHSLAELAGPLARARARWGRERVAVILGTSTGGILETEGAYAHQRERGALPPGYSVERSHALDSVLRVAATIAEVTGPAIVVSTACSSSAKVLASARRLLAAGVCDAALCGGVDTLCRLTLHGFDGLKLLSRVACRPFSSERAGINIGEGAALMLVERTGEGPARLVGVGESSDAHHMTAPHPEGLGARLAMERALADAGLPPAAIDQINAHATGTKQNDVVEGGAIAALFGSDVPVVATKGYNGHLLGAAGATEVIHAIAAIVEGYAPASVGADPIDPEIPVDVSAARRPRATAAVLSNSFAFGGSNVSVVIGGPG
ncbi:MAG: beta-ketoacyl-ACP synthase [Myxococcales bacterium]|nr:beta-ketoacyl-ACP synthase [Myxococcales bacterium]